MKIQSRDITLFCKNQIVKAVSANIFLDDAIVTVVKV